MIFLGSLTIAGHISPIGMGLCTNGQGFTAPLDPWNALDAAEKQPLEKSVNSALELLKPFF
jgi:hypothetical protein